jgi:hypothetical protein
MKKASRSWKCWNTVFWKNKTFPGRGIPSFPVLENLRGLVCDQSCPLKQALNPGKKHTVRAHDTLSVSLCLRERPKRLIADQSLCLTTRSLRSLKITKEHEEKPSVYGLLFVAL